MGFHARGATPCLLVSAFAYKERGIDHFPSSFLLQLPTYHAFLMKLQRDFKADYFHFEMQWLEQGLVHSHSFPENWWPLQGTSGGGEASPQEGCHQRAQMSVR